MPTPSLLTPKTVNINAQPPAEVLKQTFSTEGEEAMLDTSDTREQVPPERAKEPSQKVETQTEQVETKSEVTKEVANEEKVIAKSTDKQELPTKQEEKKEPTSNEPTSVLKPLLDKKGKANESTRDYTGFSDEEVRMLKNMSMEAYKYVAPKLKEHKELASQVDKLKVGSYLQHPEAYKLHPEYVALEGKSKWAEYEGNAWREQLINIKTNGKFQPIIGVKDGKLVYGEERDADVTDEEQVRQSMNTCIGVGQQVSQQLQQAPAMFQQAVTNDMKLIEDVRKQRFDWVRDPELLKFQLDIPGVGPKSIDEHRKAFINLWPVYRQNNIETQVAADLWVAMHSYAFQLREALAGKQVAEVLKEEAKNVEVTSQVKPGKQANGKWGIKEFNLQGMPD